MKVTAPLSAALLLAATLQTDAAPIPDAPATNAKGYVLTDYATGDVLAGKAADQRLEPASLTKLMTAYVVFDALRSGRLKMDEDVPISEHAWRAEGSRTFAQVGTRIPVDVLIKGMIVQSGNDASIALAERVGGTEPAFVQMMNTTASRLGMSGTHYADSSGLPSPDHYSTPADLAKLARAIIHDFPDYYGLFALREFTWNNIKQENRNGLLARDPTVDGLKTGHTDSAGYCLVTSAKRQNMRLISVVMNEPSIHAREDDSAALLTYGFNFFETVSIKKAGEMVLKPRIYKGAEPYVAVGTVGEVQITVPRGQGGEVTTNASVRQPLIAPLDGTAPVGQLQVTAGGKLIAQVPLYVLKPVAAGSWWRRLWDTIMLWFHH
jgi:serine-type D-Ala-D-Ala carboxypeptidase (penicillin-binding protein 5/6)